MQIGNQWMIPSGTEKPVDGRTKRAKVTAGECFFRFPLYINGEEDSFSPPLSEEELLLRKAQVAFFTCQLEKAQDMLEKLLQSAENRYIRIMSLFFLCSLSIMAFGGEGFLSYSGQLRIELSKEFPHKKDMQIVLPWLYSEMVQNQAVSESLEFDPQYDYSPTVRPMILYLSFYHYAKLDPSQATEIHPDVYEMLCHQLQQDGHSYEACELHFLLFLMYYLSLKKEAVHRHLKAGLSLAQEHQFYLIPACYEFFYQSVFDEVFPEFPEDFVELIKHHAERISSSFAQFSQAQNITTLYATLSKSDYQYLLLSIQGNTNKEIARALHISERTVASHLAEICEKLGVAGKAELVELFTESMK